MADGKIYITISDRRDDSGGTPGVPEPNNFPIEKSNGDKVSLKTYSLNLISNTLKSNSRKLISYSVNNYGNLTGDHFAQRDIQNAIQLATVFTEIGTSFATGTAIGGPGVGLLVATLDAGTKLLNYEISEFGRQREIEKNNREISIIRKISGLDNLTNGGRGTKD